jgi:predicted nucleotidyltransferase
VEIPLAIESGSRAWGFPSPDSDYDCRFVFVRAPDRYLSPWPPRDVIERPIEDLLDLNGWDVGKLIALLVKGNAVAVEWLQSPITYRESGGFRGALLALARQVVDREAVRRHYLSLGSSQWQRAGGGEVAIKKLFYALRPAAALHWLERHPDKTIAPMALPALLADLDLEPALRGVIDALIARKAETREMGSGYAPPTIVAFIDAAFALSFAKVRESRASTARRRDLADTVYRDLIARYGPA